MKDLILIVGKSGVGKDTAARYLHGTYSCTLIASYTSRKPRREELNGFDHTFFRFRWVARLNYLYDKIKGDVLAFVNYGKNIYWTTYTQLFQAMELCNVVIYITDKASAKAIRQDNRLKSIFRVHIWEIQCSSQHRISYGVSPERMARDKDTTYIGPDVIIVNEGTKSNLFAKLSTHFNLLLDRYGKD